MKAIRNSLLVVMAASLLTAGTVTAADRSVLTLESSISLALSQNPAVRMAEKEVSIARAGVWQSVSTILPKVDANAALQHNWDVQTNTVPNFIKAMVTPDFPGYNEMPDVVEFAFGLENTFRYGASLTQPLFLGGAGIAGIQLANSAKRASERNLEAARQNLIYQTVSAFYSTLLARELIDVQEEALAQAEANLDVVTKKYNVGSASGFDKMRAEVEVANLRPAVISARNNYQSALTLLRTTVGLDKGIAVEVEGNFTYIEDDFGNLSLSEIQDLALGKRPEIQAVSEHKNISRKGVTIARSSFLPKLFFQTELSYLAMRDDYDFGGDDFSKGFTSTISLQFPLFQGFNNLKEYQKAKLNYRIALDSEKQIHDGVIAETEVAFNKFKEAKEKYLSANQSVELAEEALRLARMMYQEGTNTQLDVLTSQLALTQARLNYVSSLYEYELARYQLRKVTGTLTGVL
jgi:outer membrane protein TolC